MSEIIADYHNFDYQKEFWTSARKYEDGCDRLALRKLLPPTGEKIADICGGYGRLVNEYFGKFKIICLFDYAQNLLKQAKASYGDKVAYYQGSAEKLPFKDKELDCLVFVRASHHFKNIEQIVAEFSRVLKPGGKVVVEIANKKHFLQVLRWLVGKSDYNPFKREPISRNAKGFYNYHHKYMTGVFYDNNFFIKEKLSVSNFRSGFFKKILGLNLLLLLEKVCQRPLGFLELGPSLYYLLEKN